MPLATFDWTAACAVAGGYLVLALLALAIRPRDVLGRRRAMGCILSLIVFFGLFALVLGGWFFGDVV